MKTTFSKKHFLFLFALFTITTSAQTIDPSFFNCMKWRMIGPHRGGRTVGACGVVQQPNTFYIGVNNGGVWKTTDYGRTWNPIFDEQSTGSIGDVQVAPGNPDVIYVGTGEGLHRPDLSVGNGIYKSADAGKTWEHCWVSENQQVGKLAVDPTDENRVFAAVLGHPYAANKERGVYRTIDGGKTWKQVLFIDENTGAIQVEIDPANPQIVFADLWQSQLGPWENSEWDGANSGLYKSIDGGNTWKKLSDGLPTAEQGLSRIGFCIAPSNHNRMYATIVANEDVAGIYRSDNAGESWIRMSGDERLWGRGDDFAELKVDPLNADIVYDANVVCWKSVDGAKTWKDFRGAPGGDDSHRFWINPLHPEIILLAGDQGAIITVNGGETWSSWYNQPTAQFYHVSTDNAFPYNVYGGQQESGSVGIASRSNDGAITFREWHSVAAEEWGYVAADPLDANIIYGGKLTRYNKLTGQFQQIEPDPTGIHHYRFIRTAPVLFSPINPKLLFYAGNVLFKTYNGGNSWKVISPDLTRTTYDVSNTIGVYRTASMSSMPQRGVIYSVAPSPLDSNTIWCGTDDGLIQVTRDGGATWKNITPPEINSLSKISMMEASHFEVNTAYAAVNRIRLDDLHPHIFKTIDGGKTWKEIVNGLPNDPINSVREDPERKGLLFAGTERQVCFSLDDGANWQTLRLNMPCSSIRDLVIKDNDLVVGTHGRSFWILDNITPLRQLTTETLAQPIILFQPAAAYRVRWNMNPDTPLPQEEPAGENPPDGAIIDYYLTSKASDVSLDILDEKGMLIQHYNSSDTLYKVGDVNIPLYWIRPQQILSGETGSHRFLWDLHYQPLNVPPSYPISAIYKNTAPNYTSPWVMPGNYTVRLTVDGKIFSQPLVVKMDPRVKTSNVQLQKQYDLSIICYDDRTAILKVQKQITSLQLQITSLLSNKPDKKLMSSLQKFSLQLDSLSKDISGSKAENFNSVNSKLETAFGILQGADESPTAQCTESVLTAHTDYEMLSKKWLLANEKVKMLNEQLKLKGWSELKL